MEHVVYNLFPPAQVQFFKAAIIMFIHSSYANTSKQNNQPVPQFGAKFELEVTRESKKHAGKIHHSKIEVDRSEDKPDGFTLTNPNQTLLNGLHYTFPTDIKTIKFKPDNSKPNKSKIYIQLEADGRTLEKDGWSANRHYSQEKTSKTPTSLNVITRDGESIVYGKVYEPVNTATIESDQGVQHRQEPARLQSIRRSPSRAHFETTFTDPSREL